jgi:trimethylamine:corrinoid methyltransferase-like protein
MNAARLTVWDDDACRRVHEATLEILTETGVEVRYGAAAARLCRAGGRC